MRRGLVVAVAALLALGAAACTSDDDPEAADTTSTAPASTTTTTTTTAFTPGPPEPGAVTVAVVSDSEVTPEIVEYLDAADGVHVRSAVTNPGWTMAQLDGDLDAALADPPDVVVYSGGANDLESLGPGGMLDALRPRLDRIGESSCAVYPVPSIDTSDKSAAEAEQIDDVLAGFESVLGQWGVRFVSYPDIADALEDEGLDFYAEGELGSFHPGEAAFEPIGEALAAAVTACAG